MNRDICVVASRPKLLRQDELAGDLLAFSLPSMAALSNSHTPFLTPEDVYPRLNVEADTKAFAEATSNWLAACDQVCESELRLERAFSSNGFWFIHRLSDIYYLHCLAGRIIRAGKTIRFVSGSEILPLPRVRCDFGKLRFVDVGVGLDHALTFLASAIPGCSSRVDDRGGVIDNPVSAEPIYSLIRRTPEIITRRLKARWGSPKTNMSVCGPCFWVVQGGYDVDVLKDAWPDAKFINIAPKLVADAMHAPTANVSAIQRKLFELTAAFAKQWLPAYSFWLGVWIADYLNNVVARLPGVVEKLDQLLINSAPNAILYSIGAQTVLEGEVARSANRKGIPVYFFKHGGLETQFFTRPSILDKFFEQDPTIERTQFVHCKEEEEHFRGMSRVRTRVLGPLVRWPDRTNKKPCKPLRILYSVGPPAHYSFKEMSRSISDAERFRFATSLLDVAANFCVPLDVKVHPGEWRVGWDFFNELLNGCAIKKRNTRLIAGGSIERMIDEYGLIIFDMVSTRVLSESFLFDIPRIVYIPPEFQLGPSKSLDLKTFVYLTRSDEELRMLLGAFRDGNLPARTGKEFNKRFKQFTSEEAVNAVKAEILSS